jgi:hypothetical protein
MAAPTGSSIFDVLERAGIERHRGKMVCCFCHERKVTASESRGVATCWGCDAHWNADQEAATPPDRDWGIHILTKIAVKCQDHLRTCGPAMDWLEHRRLPINEMDWLLDQDLGAVPNNLTAPMIEGVVRGAKVLLHEAVERLKAKQQVIMGKATSVASRDTKAIRAAQKESDVVQLQIDEEQKAFHHLTCNILPLLLNPDWHDAMVYIYRDQDGEPCSLNCRQYKVEPSERKVMRIQPGTGKRGVFGMGQAQFRAGAAWPAGFPSLIIVEGEHNLLSLAAAVKRWGIENQVRIIAVGGKNGADIPCIEAIAGGEEPLVIYDNDKVDPATGKPGGYCLVEAVTERMYCEATTTDTKDLDDYFKLEKLASPRQVVVDVFFQSDPVPIAIKTIRAKVQFYLCTQMEANAKEIAVTELIVNDATRRAKLYNVDGYGVLLLPAGPFTASYISIRHKDVEFHDFLRQYGVSKPDWVDACGRAINIEAAKLTCPRRDLHSVAAAST